MCTYFSKSEDEASEAMKQVAKEAVKENLNVFEKMKAISKAYTTIKTIGYKANSSQLSSKKKKIIIINK